MRVPDEIWLLDILRKARNLQECPALHVGNSLSFLWRRGWRPAALRVRCGIARLKLVKGESDFLIPLWVLSAALNHFRSTRLAIELGCAVRRLLPEMSLIRQIPL